MQTCTGCGRQLPIDAFGWRDKSAGTRKRRCRDCSADYQRRWYQANAVKRQAEAAVAKRRRHQRNRTIVVEAKAVPCADCGRRFQTEQMDFDHVDASKDGNIARLLWSVGEARLRAEMAECEVVCANCHRVRTARRLR